MISRYVQAFHDEWFEVPRGGVDIACCSCSLVHDLKVRVRNKHIEVKFNPDMRKTAALRRTPKTKGERHST
jgi:hypothetical protein